MHSKEGTEPELECGSPKLEIHVSTSLLDVTSRDPPSPPSFWPGHCPCPLPELDLAFPISPKDLMVHLPGAASQGALA